MSSRSAGSVSGTSSRRSISVPYSHEGSPRSAAETIGEGLGLTAQAVATGDEGAQFVFVSDSMQEILGYAPEELIGKSTYLLGHPDEAQQLREIHYRALREETVACVVYMRLLHREGHFVEVCVSYSVVHGLTVLSYTRAEDGPRTVQQTLTAREVIEVSPNSQGKWIVKRISPSSPSSRPTSTSSSSSHALSDQSGIEAPWDLPPPHPRTFFFIDRFTDTSRVIFSSNDVICNTSRIKNQSFYSIIKPSDRPLVRQYIGKAKAWSPVVQNEKRSGGHGYCNFSVLKIPDLPPHGETYPQGTDESEKSMPGQEFIPVEGIFTASSDGLACIISRMSKRE